MNALWVLSRATGMVSLALLTVVMVLGIVVQRQRRMGTLPRFVVVGLHRNAALLAVALLVVHVATVVYDPYVSIRWVDAVVPFLGELPAVLVGARRAGGRPGRGPGRDQPASAPDAGASVAGGALDGVRVLAGGARPRHRHRHRPARHPRSAARRGVHRGGRGRGRLALAGAATGGCTAARLGPHPGAPLRTVDPAPGRLVRTVTS